jgi:uncharacterized membrane protein
MDKSIRSLLKAISWRIVATLTTMLLVLVFTGNLVLSGEVGIVELVVKIAAYYLHERAWNLVSLGRK